MLFCIKTLIIEMMVTYLLMKTQMILEFQKILVDVTLGNLSIFYNSLKERRNKNNPGLYFRKKLLEEIINKLFKLDVNAKKEEIIRSHIRIKGEKES